MLVGITRALLKFAAWKRQIQIILGEKHEWLHNFASTQFQRRSLWHKPRTGMDFTSSFTWKVLRNWTISFLSFFFFARSKKMIEMLFFDLKMKWYERKKYMMLIKRCDSEKKMDMKLYKWYNCMATRKMANTQLHCMYLHSIWVSGKQKKRKKKKEKNCRQQQSNWFIRRINRFTCFQLACRWQSFAFSCHALTCYANECLWWCDNAQPLPMM